MASQVTQQREQRSGNGRGDSPSQEITRQAEGMVKYLREYARENPESAALWCFGIGFVLGWKLKIW